MAGMMSSDRDPARVALASAIALHAGAVRDWQVAQSAAELAERRHWQSQSALDELRKAVADPSGVLADSFISSVASGAPCGTDVLERSAIDARAKMTAAENDVRVWKQTHDECAQGVVTSLKEEHENSASRIFSNDRDCLAPHVHSRRAKGSVRPCRSEMTLDVESVVGGCVS
jgi:hypothetical protein